MLNMELIGAAVFVLFVIVAVIAIYEYVVTQRKLVDTWTRSATMRSARLRCNSIPVGMR